MNKLIACLILLFLTIDSFSQCTPTALDSVGFSPVSDSLPCAEIGSSFNETFSIRFLDSTFIQSVGNSIYIRKLEIDSVTNLPEGITATFSNADMLLKCISLSGTPFGSAQKRRYNIYISAEIELNGDTFKLASLELTQYCTTISQAFTIPYSSNLCTQPFLKVINPGDTCELFTSIHEVSSSLISSSVCPNPASGKVTIVFPKSLNDFEIIISELSGKIIARQMNHSGNKAELLLSGLQNGIYFYEAVQHNSRISHGRIIVVN